MIVRRAPIARHSGRKGKKASKRRKQQKALAEKCASLWSQYIKRDGQCAFIGRRVGNGVHEGCGGALQAMHGFGKKAYPAARYAAWNGFPGCAAVHAYYTWRSPEWENFLRSEWGDELYALRLRQAMTLNKPDLSLVSETYRAVLAGTREAIESE